VHQSAHTKNRETVLMKIEAIIARRRRGLQHVFRIDPEFKGNAMRLVRARYAADWAFHAMAFIMDEDVFQADYTIDASGTIAPTNPDS